MNELRQSTFLKLKPVCVQLSGVALRFRTNQAPVKEVLHALEQLKKVLDELSTEHRLDPKLAEYAFFPLAQQVFNETKRLSPRCLEVAVDCVSLLVAHGYGQAIQPALAKQLIILMSMLAGAGPQNQAAIVSDDLQVSSLSCISVIIKTLTASSAYQESFFDDQGTQNVVDQLTYLLVELIVNSDSPKVQSISAKVLYQLLQNINNHTFLASLLPRTASSLTKALTPSTKIRRSAKVLTLNLETLTLLIEKTIKDESVNSIKNDHLQGALDESWLRATVAQIKNVLLQVCKLRNNEAANVQYALEELCALVIEQCQNSLENSLPIVLETLLILAAHENNTSAKAKCHHFLLTYPTLNDLLRTSLSHWSDALPRHLQANDERVKQVALRRLSAAIPLLAIAERTTLNDLQTVLLSLGEGLASILSQDQMRMISINNGDEVEWNKSLTVSNKDTKHEFSAFMFAEENLKTMMSTLDPLLDAVRGHPECLSLAQKLVDISSGSEGLQRATCIWLALQLLRDSHDSLTDIDDFVVGDTNDARGLTRMEVLSELHATTFPLLADVATGSSDIPAGWQLQALAMETLTAYAEQFPADTYRPELIDTLYPVISFLASPNLLLRQHALVSLNRLAVTCQYSSAQDLVIANVDYLVNSVAWKLNTYNLAPEAPQILRMLVLLCGARLVPYLDDLVQAIFGALDSFHGYPEWVELLFSSLKAIVDVAVQEPKLVITEGDQKPAEHRNIQPSNLAEILSDLGARKRRRDDLDRDADEPPASAPHRPWTKLLDGPTFPKPADTEEDLLNQDDEDNEHGLPPADPSEEEKKLSKSHNLLLQIASATIPHLASPLGSVREVLLDLLKELSPLLGQNQESFLPLINSIWPVIVPRLFAEDNGNEEPAQNIIAAAETIVVLCETAGDFMAGRIEDIFQQLMRMLRSVEKQASSVRPADAVASSSKGVEGTNSLKLESQPEVSKAVMRSRSGLRTSKDAILQALVKLLASVLKNVQLSMDTSDEIATAILPFAFIDADIGPTVEAYNRDLAWLYGRHSGLSTSKTVNLADMGPQTMPRIRHELQELGFVLPNLIEMPRPSS